jgi:hypothetical protein
MVQQVFLCTMKSNLKEKRKKHITIPIAIGITKVYISTRKNRMSYLLMKNADGTFYCSNYLIVSIAMVRYKMK